MQLFLQKQRLSEGDPEGKVLRVHISRHELARSSVEVALERQDRPFSEIRTGQRPNGLPQIECTRRTETGDQGAVESPSGGAKLDELTHLLNPKARTLLLAKFGAQDVPRAGAVSLSFGWRPHADRPIWEVLANARLLTQSSRSDGR
ncbi:hypothetical protein [Aestuariivirga sp.]|uniref:hypothetical protein n=1 Tax=Aestuariivirga sp. TaxID=2650926 RepID=UPI0039E72962